MFKTILLFIAMAVCNCMLASDYVIPPTTLDTQVYNANNQACRDKGMATITILFVAEPRFSNLGRLTNEWVSETNRYYRESKIWVKLKKVGLIPHTFKATDMNTKLRELSKHRELRNARDDYKADLVLGVVDKGSTRGIAGMAFMGINPDYAHSVVNGTVDSLVVAHEIGHNLGLGHSKLQKSNGSVYKWGRGYGVKDKFGTIMSYAYLYPAPWIKKFSNPSVRCAGLPCGIGVNKPNGANSARAINCVRFRVSRHR